MPDHGSVWLSVVLVSTGGKCHSAKGLSGMPVWTVSAVLAAVLALLGPTACHDHATPVRPAIRLVDERRTRPDDASTAAVPLAKVGGVFRPVLELPPTCASVYQIASRPLAGKVIRVPIPEALRGRRRLVYATLAAIAGPVPAGLRSGVPLGVEEAAQVVDAGLGPSTALTPLESASAAALDVSEHLTFALDDSGSSAGVLLTVIACPRPKQRYESARISVPQGARLRFALGVARLANERAASRFTVTAVVDGREVRLLRTVFPTAPKGWEDHDVDLTRYGGKAITLRFESTVKVEKDGTVPRLVWADPTVVSLDPAANRRRNVLLISLDTLRPDRLGCYGYPRPTSPAIDAELAARGTLFTHAFASFPSTAGSHATIFTSLDPCVHGFVDTLAPPPLRADAPTLAELLRMHGYETAAFTEGSWLVVPLGFARGFGTYSEYAGADPDPNSAAGGAAGTFGATLNWIEAHRDRPWFVFAHTYQLHHPYEPPPGYLDLVGVRATDTTASDSDRYDAEIRYTDDLLGMLLAGLDHLDLTRSTVIVLLADHGELFGEHGGLGGHGHSLWDTLLRVPLILRAPGLVPAQNLIDAPVGLIDVVPTILDLLGLAPDPWAQGRSVVPLLHGAALPERILFAEVARWRGQVGMLIAARRGDLKWIIDLESEKSLAFDLSRDSGEEHDLSAQLGADTPRRILEEFAAHCAAVAPKRPRDGEALDPARRMKLRELGYVDSRSDPAARVFDGVAQE